MNDLPKMPRDDKLNEDIGAELEKELKFRPVATTPAMPKAAPLNFVSTALLNAAKLHQTKAEEYGDGYKAFGPVAAALFPKGLPPITSVEHWNRLGVLVQMIGKLVRYSYNFERGGHDDSLDDMAVYAMLLKELDVIAGKRKP